jgi:hypothetical protein
VIVTVFEVDVVGVPEITPSEELRVRPFGNEPDVTAYVTAPSKFEAVMEDEFEIGLATEPETV